MTTADPVDRTAEPKTGGRARHPDRAGLPAWLLGGLVVTTSVAVGCAAWSVSSGQSSLAPAPAFLLGTLASTLAIVGLPSLSLRVVTRAMGAASAAGLVRYGLLGGMGSSNVVVMASWVIALVGIVVFSEQVGDGKRPASRADRTPGEPMRPTTS